VYKNYMWKKYTVESIDLYLITDMSHNIMGIVNPTVSKQE